MLDDAGAMTLAVAAGERGRRTAAPNPWVGCIVERDGQVVGEGFHARVGEPHAEVHALSAAGPAASGATAYVTLEPCSHWGRTPPCAEALIQAGIRRVVVAVEDPDARVQGSGMARLRAAGVEVEVGVGAGEARESLAPYLHHRRTGRPLCLLKTAASLDGRTAAADGGTRWITGPESRADVHALRADSQAILVGAGTALADQPSLTARDVSPPPDRQPLRVLLDSTGRVLPTGPLFDVTLAPTLVLTTASAPTSVLAAWRAAGAEVKILAHAPSGTGVDLRAALDLLGGRGILQLLVEGGPIVHGAFLRAGLADRLVVFLAGLVLGAEAQPLFAGLGPIPLDMAPRWRITSARTLGPSDVRLDYAPL